MNDGFGFCMVERPCEFRSIAQLRLDETGALIHGGSMSLGQIVVDCHRMAGVEQLLHANRPDIPRPSSDKNIHGSKLSMKCSICKVGDSEGHAREESAGEPDALQTLRA